MSGDWRKRCPDCNGEAKLLMDPETNKLTSDCDTCKGRGAVTVPWDELTDDAKAFSTEAGAYLGARARLGLLTEEEKLRWPRLVERYSK